jgi:hypothetical protein
MKMLHTKEESYSAKFTFRAKDLSFFWANAVMIFRNLNDLNIRFGEKIYNK